MNASTQIASIDDARSRILYSRWTREELAADVDVLAASGDPDDIMLVRLMRNEVLFSNPDSEVGDNCRLLTDAELGDAAVKAWSPAYPVDLPDDIEEPALTPARWGWRPAVAVAAVLACAVGLWSWGAL